MTLIERIEGAEEGLLAKRVKAMLEMMHYDDSDTPCLSAKHLADRANISEQEARDAARAFVAAGLAEVETGLVNSDGEFYGSGWCLTDTGVTFRAALHAIGDTHDD